MEVVLTRFLPSLGSYLGRHVPDAPRVEHQSFFFFLTVEGLHLTKQVLVRFVCERDLAVDDVLVQNPETSTFRKKD